MKAIINYLRQYFYEVNKFVLSATIITAGLFIFLNYHFFIEYSIAANPSPVSIFAYRYIIYLPAFAIPYFFILFIRKEKSLIDKNFAALLLLAPAVFSLKTTLNFRFNISDNYDKNYFWELVLYWPLLTVMIVLILLIVWRLFHQKENFYGIKTKGIDWKPYWLMLLIMLPLIGAASTQNDFLQMYPRMKMMTGFSHPENFGFWEKLLFELSYGSDFISIELFFRGFLVLGFVKWFGKDVILPMALFYCTIHFGKPLGECISSFFGGILLGVIAYNTRSILGGLIVHLGIAWLMELGGYVGNQLFRNG
jgi:hypothetical protein